MLTESRFLEFFIPRDRISDPASWKEFFHRSAPLELEIGFGLGEHLIRVARECPKKDFIGLEQNWERIAKTLKAIHQPPGKNQDGREIKNIRLVKADARVALERFFAPKTLDGVYCLFPCPWPKKSHIKHRLFSNQFLKLLNSRMKDKGCVKIVTDFQPYIQWVLGQVEGSGFSAQNKNIPPRYQTKFEKKWQQKGQTEFYEINLIKEKNISWPVAKEVALKSYQLKHFNPKNFIFENYKKDVSVISKETFFDPQKEKLLAHLIVAEEGLVQHFWVTIEKKKSVWMIYKTDGQNFYATQAVATALELVYDAAQKTSHT